MRRDCGAASLIANPQKQQSFTVEDAKDAEEEQSPTAKDTMVAKEKKTLTAKIAKDAKVYEHE